MNMKKENIVCGKCGGSNPSENIKCEYCEQEFSKIVEGKPIAEFVEKKPKETQNIIFKEKALKKPFNEIFKCSFIFGILSVLSGCLSIVVLALILYFDIWCIPFALLFSVLSYIFANMQAKRCYGYLSILGKGIGILSFCITSISILVYVIFVSIISLFI